MAQDFRFTLISSLLTLKLVTRRDKQRLKPGVFGDEIEHHFNIIHIIAIFNLR